MFQGTIEGASVYPRIVVQTALKLNGATIVCFHNHPLGVAEPNLTDESLTRRQKDALAHIGVRVLDSKEL